MPGFDGLFRHEILPFIGMLLGLVLAALLVDLGLHLADAVWVGRWLGIPGVLLILASSAYSARKRKLISTGDPMVLLRWHEAAAWSGSLLVLVHAGIHFNAILAWLAVAAMLVNVASGLTGKYLLKRARLRLDGTRKRLLAEGMATEAVRERLHWDSLTVDALKSWRVVHVPITLAFAVLAAGHLLAIALFWSWR